MTGTEAYPRRVVEGPSGRGAGLAGWLRDARYAARTLRRNPAHAAVTVATLGVGIGAVTVVFSLVNLMLFAPLPFEQPEELVILHDVVSRPGRPAVEYTPRTRSLQTMRELLPELGAAGHRFGTFHVTGGGEPTQAIGVELTDGWFETVGTAPALGRAFSREEQLAGSGSNAVIVGHDLWRRALGGSADAVGRTLLLNGEPHLLVGVMPPGHAFPWGAEVWVQGRLDPTENVSFGTVARLPDGMSLEGLRTRLAEASGRARTLYPEAFVDTGFGATRLRDYLVGNRDRIAWMLLASVALLLALACANVAGLGTVRVLGQESELAVRAALGSGRWPLFRLVFMEGLLLAVAGALVGVGLALLLQRQLLLLAGGPQSGVGLLLEMQLDYRVLGFVCLVTGVTAVLASTLPALRGLVAERAATLTRTRGGGEDRGTALLLSGAVVVQATTGVILLIVSAAVGRAYLELETTTRGYESELRTVVRVVLPEERYPEGAGRAERLEETVRRLEENPEVVAAGYTHHLPMTPGDWPRQFTFESSRDGVDVSGNVNARWVGPGYFKAIGLELLAGRTFSAEEMDRAAPVAVISADVARALSANPAAAVGTRIKMGLRDDDVPWREVVGVVEQAREEWSFPEALYLPYSDALHAWVEMVVHTRPGTDETGLASRLQEIDPDQPVDDIRSLASLQAGELRAERLSAGIVALLAAGGLAITLLGTWGLVAFRVRRRRRELGIRMALGCPAPRVAWLVVRRSVALLAAGSALALLLTVTIVLPLVGSAEAASDLAEMQLLVSGLEVDPAGTSAVIGLVLATGALACLAPVLRALRADPLRAITDE